MMAKKTETAEQKLLKMIESSSGPSAVPSKTQKKFASKKSIISLIKLINKCLLAVLVLFLFLLGNEIVTGTALLNKDIDFSKDEPVQIKTVNLETLIPTIQKTSYYLADIKRRNLFKPYEEVTKKASVTVSKENKRIVKETENLRLVGISWLDKVDTASVMIEDLENGTTYFLRQGEKIDNIIVKTIYADSVLLGYENEEIIIHYDKSQM